MSYHYSYSSSTFKHDLEKAFEVISYVKEKLEQSRSHGTVQDHLLSMKASEIQDLYERISDTHRYTDEYHLKKWFKEIKKSAEAAEEKDAA
ncbi:MAG: hypothetical protein RIQ56_235 [Candidatus Parcubacteria bacterium]|jgi:hypothetical protein